MHRRFRFFSRSNLGQLKRTYSGASRVLLYVGHFVEPSNPKRCRYCLLCKQPGNMLVDLSRSPLTNVRRSRRPPAFRGLDISALPAIYLAVLLRSKRAPIRNHGRPQRNYFICCYSKNCSRRFSEPPDGKSNSHTLGDSKVSSERIICIASTYILKV